MRFLLTIVATLFAVSATADNGDSLIEKIRQANKSGIIPDSHLDNFLSQYQMRCFGKFKVNYERSLDGKMSREVFMSDTQRLIDQETFPPVKKGTKVVEICGFLVPEIGNIEHYFKPDWYKKQGMRPATVRELIHFAERVELSDHSVIYHATGSVFKDPHAKCCNERHPYVQTNFRRLWEFGLDGEVRRQWILAVKIAAK